MNITAVVTNCVDLLMTYEGGYAITNHNRWRSEYQTNKCGGLYKMKKYLFYLMAMAIKGMGTVASKCLHAIRAIRVIRGYKRPYAPEPFACTAN